ncbi:alpha/beta hydrolase [Paenibacillus chibensis]|uniref:alpha/beta hydrolase n=1 Tax=Paenibacillus chibensis TaxID=59846 RepID=UPI000FD94884|nr:alpha/beta hydrolase-fold protein [Paenibacillus chibensis]MEC0370187.1 alpha/beta hydrolase-fold protein [Paenibacillus chibensis]
MNPYQQLHIGERRILVYLPPSYALNADRHYPAAYVQDGGDLFADCHNYIEHLYASGQLEETILIGIVPHARGDEYTPWRAQALVSGNPAFGGQGLAYVNEVADVIKPYIDSHFRTKKEAEHTAMIGGSFGGLISWFAGCWRPEVFGRLGLISASFWYEGVMNHLRDYGGAAEHQRVYMSVGDHEGVYKTNRQRDMVDNTKTAYQLLREKGAEESRLKLEIVPEGTHDPVFMARQLPKALAWLFGAGDAGGGRALNRAESFRIPGTATWSMRSGKTGRQYRIFIAEPMGPSPETGYPVLYSLDANASFGSLAEAARLQTRGPHGITPVLIVGIGYDSEQPIVSKERFWDYTVHADASELPPRPDGSAWPPTGGAEAFLDFLEHELKPAVEAAYPVDRSRQSLFGHSLGGFLTLYTLLTRPETYRRYFAASPSIWWKNQVLLQLWEQNQGRLGLEKLGAELHLSVGQMEKPHMVRDAEQFYDMLSSSGYGPQKLSMRVVEEEGHVSLLPALISPMLRRVTV